MDLTSGGGMLAFSRSLSVHNICIERLWVDLTNGIGSKWKAFFQDLEVTSSLNVDNAHHIWLLHHFTPNYGLASPHEMHFFSMLQDEDILGDDDAIAEYWIDWDDMENHGIRSHHDLVNQHDPLDNNPFVAYIPETLNHIQVDEPNCPLSPEQLAHLCTCLLGTHTLAMCIQLMSSTD
ncbi:hypothetical protein EDB19DRAFT_1896728 [Suillus lakei]|nr:hypothetical protein EDB19DRAFT_1896728 [Suillus lakei]